jgi:hypothetical protein
MRGGRALAAAGLVAGVLAWLLGCGGPAPTMPPAMASSIGAWAAIGLSCTGPASSNDPDGLLKWTCTGTLHATALTAALDGDARGLFLASVSVPADTPKATIVAVFADVADATTAYATVAPQIRAWLGAWSGNVDGITIGPASLAIATAVGSPPTTTLYLTGPRKNVGDPS